MAEADTTAMFDPSPSYFWAWSWAYSPRLIAAGNVDDLSDTQGSNLDVVFVGNGYEWEWGPTNWVGVLLGDGRGGFSQAWFDSYCDEPRGLALGDFTGDGHADIAFGDPWGYVHLMAGDGYGNFAPPAAFSVGAGVANLAAGDFTGDGVTGPRHRARCGKLVTVLTIDTPGGFESPVTFDIGISDSHALAAADFDADGDLDLAVTSYGSHRSVQILNGNGDGTFDLLSDVYDSGGVGPAYITSGDFNDDGIPDLAVANSSNSTVGVLLGNGDGSFLSVLTSNAVANGATGAEFLATADFNQDGLLDLAVASSSGSLFRVLPGNGSGMFSEPIAPPNGGFTTLAAGDFDNDGKVDVAGVTPWSPGAAILWNRFGPYRVAEGGSLMLTAANSTDMNGNIVAYEWDLDGDNQFGETGAEATRGDEDWHVPNLFGRRPRRAIDLDRWPCGSPTPGDCGARTRRGLVLSTLPPSVDAGADADHGRRKHVHRFRLVQRSGCRRVDRDGGLRRQHGCADTHAQRGQDLRFEPHFRR